MMEQLDLFATEPTEEWVFELLKDELFRIIMRNNVAKDKLLCKRGKTYSSVWYDTQLAFRICSRGEHHYFGISDAYKVQEEDNLECYITKDGRCDGFTNYSFEPTPDGVLEYGLYLGSCLDKAIDSVTKEFDCCSRYEECSDAMRCTNPNPDFATGCGYRKIMKSGRIFYGKNRNI